MSPKLRADAQRNRDRIVSRARDILITHGPNVPMESIVAHVGVGVGTLYRRFPNRDSLLTAVAAEMFRTATAAATRIAQEESDEWTAVVRTVQACASPHIGTLSAALMPWLSTHREATPLLRELSTQWQDQFDVLVTNAQAAGRMRTDISTPDVLQLISLVTCHLSDTAAVDGQASLRYLNIVLDGLRVGGGDRATDS